MSDFLFNTGIIFFILDNFISLNTSYFDKGSHVQDRHTIFQNYIKNKFINDFVSNIPVIIDYFIIQLNGFWSYIMIIQYLKLNRISLIIRKLEEIFHLTPTQQQLVSLVKLLITVLFIAHIFACIWIFIAVDECVQSWIIKQQYENKVWQEQYLLAIYFSTVTMITVGYGDVLPTNAKEYILCIITMLISCGVFAYAVNQIGSIFELLGRQDKELKENMYRISNYMYIKKVSKELQYEVRQYLQYYWKEEQNRDTKQEETIINQLSDKLKEQLVLEANNLVLKDSVIFKNNFSEILIKKTVPLINESRITPEEIITIEGFLDDCCIFFIEKGEIEVYIDQYSEAKMYTQQIQKLKSGDAFGVVSFFTGNTRKLSIRSLDFTTLLSIKRQDFLNLLKDFPEDYEQFVFIKDQLQLNGNFKQIGTRCYSCRDFKHMCDNCPFIHYSPKKFLLLKRIFRNIFQNRNNLYKRKHRYKKNAKKYFYINKFDITFNQLPSSMTIEENGKIPSFRSFPQSIFLFQNKIQ
ncbi:cation channel family protein, putative [Ichthyophthirius multifiliis]|uniref:Cation channel family protein, putative n=1 Tax=Ichthyophthirius multifiliis TaxID=5932 RepID=G0QWW3_ICHMU|nr:cation channel family protein, putative [Ichthyophthirius multifiliis]EGR30305.1 cation channel family protein, putative [Ichthyophthirius multifiliis]|eukprot:XP_004031892.1 cation channel family protein, putative [Ichthyophthirius multifiliis]